MWQYGHLFEQGGLGSSRNKPRPNLKKLGNGELSFQYGRALVNYLSMERSLVNYFEMPGNGEREGLGSYIYIG